MEATTTPKKSRPKLQARSHTATAWFSSPESKEASPKDAPPQEGKRHQHPLHHIDLFGHLHQNHNSTSRHNQHLLPAQLHLRRRRSEEKVGSKMPSLKQHVPNAVSEITQMVYSGASHVKSASLRSTTSSADREVLEEFQNTSAVPTSIVRPEDVERERYRRKQQEAELQSAFDRLSDQAQRSTRRFDFIYYYLLEKVTRLHGMIGSLQELSKSSAQLQDNFAAETSRLLAEAQRQIDGFENFAEQQDSVRGLEARIETGKQRTEELGKRLEEARRRAQVWEEGEAEWQARASKRLTIVQFGIIAAVVLVAVLVALRNYRHTAQVADVQALDELTKSSGLPVEIVEDLVEVKSRRLAAAAAATAASSGAQQAGASGFSRKEEPLLADGRLHGFDEL